MGCNRGRFVFHDKWFCNTANTEKHKNWKIFLINRFSRLYPTYWACVTITAVFLFLFGDIIKSKLVILYLSNMTMLQYYLLQPHLDEAYWTMTVELLFYVYMLFIFLIKKLDDIERISVRLLFFVFVYGLLALYPKAHSLYNGLSYIPLINHFPLFCSGIIFYNIKFTAATKRRYFYLLVCFIAQVFVFKTGGKSRFFINVYEYAFILSIYFGLLYLFAVNKLKFIVNRVTVFLGNLSFSLYLIHQTIGAAVISFLQQYINWTLAFGVTLLLVILLAYLINRLVEVPATKYLRKKLHSNHTQIPAAVTL
ncbi:acyltransferase [Mucilaginibacter sp. S1162]|uniref:Acyltransferase n=1 Tax=Mucilaginibacter humi TaxID=2732510 RepID=A0ABX1W1J5_9SPHI|nr:acyltransferase [Mucilaginibacter humi]NNU33531.1 acyltransferase [Mucilaginibacter humi]